MASVRISRVWEAETAVCIATGPSLTQADCDYVRGKARVICINDAYRLAPWADVLYSSDRRWWPFHQGVPGFQGMKFGIGSALGIANPFHDYPEIQVLRNTGLLGLDTNPEGLRSGQHSGFACLNLAIHFGVRRILMLGYDLSYDRGRAHFFGDHAPGLNQNEALYPGFRRAYGSIVEPLHAIGVEVENCSRRTSLETFSLMPLEEALPGGAVRVA